MDVLCPSYVACRYKTEHNPHGIYVQFCCITDHIKSCAKQEFWPFICQTESDTFLPFDLSILITLVISDPVSLKPSVPLWEKSSSSAVKHHMAPQKDKAKRWIQLHQIPPSEYFPSSSLKIYSAVHKSFASPKCLATSKLGVMTVWDWFSI